MRLLDLIQEQHCVGPASHGLRQLASLLVPDVAWRCSEQPGDSVLLHVLAHVYPHHGVFVVEQELGKCPGCLRLSYPRRSEEDEAAQRPVRILQSGARAAYSVRYCGQRVVLTHQPHSKALLHVEQFLDLTLHHAAHGHTGPSANYLGDVVLVDFLAHEGVLLLRGQACLSLG